MPSTKEKRLRGERRLKSWLSLRQRAMCPVHLSWLSRLLFSQWATWLFSSISTKEHNIQILIMPPIIYILIMSLGSCCLQCLGLPGSCSLLLTQGCGLHFHFPVPSCKILAVCRVNEAVRCAFEVSICSGDGRGEKSTSLVHHLLCASTIVALHTRHTRECLN